MSSDHRGPAFPSTRWSRILAAPAARDLDALARDYARPIEAWLGARLRLSADDAHELLQEAFAWMLATRFFDRADPARGRFRALLKTALAHFAIEQQRRASAHKRGGGIAHEPLDAAIEQADPRQPMPDQVLDDAWRRELLQRASALLERELTDGQRRTHWLVFRDYFLADDDGVDYRALAARHGISTTDVSNWLTTGKQRYRAILRRLVTETVHTDDDLETELRWLFGPEAGPS